MTARIAALLHTSSVSAFVRCQWGNGIAPPAVPSQHLCLGHSISKPNVISLFDGIAIGRQALLHLGFRQLGGDHAFELSHNAMAVANSNHSDITQHGDVGEVCK